MQGRAKALFAPYSVNANVATFQSNGKSSTATLGCAVLWASPTSGMRAVAKTAQPRVAVLQRHPILRKKFANFLSTGPECVDRLPPVKNRQGATMPNRRDFIKAVVGA